MSIRQGDQAARGRARVPRAIPQSPGHGQGSPGPTLPDGHVGTDPTPWSAVRMQRWEFCRTFYRVTPPLETGPARTQDPLAPGARPHRGPPTPKTRSHWGPLTPEPARAWGPLTRGPPRTRGPLTPGAHSHRSLLAPGAPSHLGPGPYTGPELSTATPVPAVLFPGTFKNNH